MPPRWTPWLIVGVILAPVLVMTRVDPDLWGHVRFGLDTLAAHSLPSVDPYSFTQDVPWVNHEWLSELMMGVAFRLGGTAGLALLKGCLVALVFVLALGAYAEAPPLMSFVVLVLVAGGTGRVITSLRPQLWSLLGVALLCRLLTTPPRRAWLVGVPLLFAVWANMHGGWIVGAGILAIWTVGELWRGQTARGLVIGVAALSALATLVNPYGWELWGFLAGTVRLSREISEWQPLFTTPVTAWIPWLVVLAGVAASAVSTRRPRFDRLATIAVLAYASFNVERLAPLFVVAAVLLMGPTVLAHWRTTSRPFNPVSRGSALALALSVLVVAAISLSVATKAASCIPIAGEWIPDRVAGRALVQGGARGTIVTWFDWGQYAIWHMSPSLRVSLDGRRETVYSNGVLRNHEAMNDATPEGLAYLEHLHPSYVWLPASSGRVGQWLETHGYRLDVQTSESFVAVRDDQPVLRVSDAPLPSCFPGP